MRQVTSYTHPIQREDGLYELAREDDGYGAVTRLYAGRPEIDEGAPAHGEIQTVMGDSAVTWRWRFDGQMLLVTTEDGQPAALLAVDGLETLHRLLGIPSEALDWI